MNAYAKYFDKNNKYMGVLVNDKEFLFLLIQITKIISIFPNIFRRM